MGLPAARLGDYHVCPSFTGPVPHLGGPVIPPVAFRVLIGGMPAAHVGSMCVCVGPPDVVVMGSFKVLVGGMPAARVTSQTAHGGMVALGCLKVLVG
jgi:uncharacterized Zn-binding protein involved in type VI secretion